jgi:hypothetical protein
MPPSVERLCSNRGALYLARQNMNLIISDFTFEYTENQVHTASELDRILLSGGFVSHATDTLCRGGKIAGTVDRDDSCFLERADVKRRGQVVLEM